MAFNIDAVSFPTTLEPSDYVVRVSDYLSAMVRPEDGGLRTSFGEAVYYADGDAHSLLALVLSAWRVHPNYRTRARLAIEWAARNQGSDGSWSSAYLRDMDGVYSVLTVSPEEGGVTTSKSRVAQQCYPLSDLLVQEIT